VSRRAAALLVALAVVALAVVAVVLSRTADDGQPDADASAGTPAAGEPQASGDWTVIDAEPSDEVDVAVTELPQIPGRTGPMRVDDDLAPPTNRWYSGLLFGDAPQPVFPVPLALLTEQDGVTIGLPEVTATETTVAGPFVPGLRLGVEADEFVATAADPVSLTLTYRAGGTDVGRLVTAGGWPYVGYTAVSDQRVTVPATMQQSDGGWLVEQAGESQYGVVVVDGTGEARDPVAQDGRIELAADETVLLFGAPDEQVATALAERAAPLTGVETAYRTGADETVTRLRYLTLDDQPTALATMPHHQMVGAELEPLGEVPSIWGALALHDGTELTTAVPTLEPRATLDLSGLDERQRAELAEQVRRDVETELSGPASPTDSYFGGKTAYRMAQLARLAQDVGEKQLAADMRERVVSDLETWFTQSCSPGTLRCVAYDPEFRGVVAQEPSFGSEQFNDHHFHYGYFIAAAALVAEDDPALVERWGATLTALAADIAAPASSSALPALRVFDPYAGHSWASGTAPFADGNNQESSSEAVNAWNGLAHWARVSGDERLADQATWQLSLEAATARGYWVEPTDLAPEFAHQVVALNWGGKRDWATWFSAEPSAMLGIQLIPMGPVSTHLGGDPDRVRANVDEAAGAGYDVLFGDYLLMYLALADAEQALEQARDLPDERIDDGNTRSYLLAWVMAQGSS
jgi:endoglucanase Acf2